MTASRPRWRALLLMAVGVAVVVAVLGLVWNGSAVREWKENAGVVPFFGAMTLLPLVGIPLTPFFLAAGATFGPRIGIAGSLAALGANLGLSYWLAQSRIQPLLANLLARAGYALPSVETSGRGLRFALLVKFAPGLPAVAKNYLLGMAGVSFPIYFVLSMVVTGLYGTALLVLGESVFAHDVDRSLVIAAVIVLLPIGAWLWRRRPPSGLRARPS